ncbi:hypothetical protein PIB30_083828 [Stylosanthes scabra]|uniref:Putative plant transposon protein domain-containing protein n=1 Tax=Stylosanthes scabra TaxID=79078 RepID=A0ABU6VSJ1_9FABA|nr:hypothetical protein [Stylosanthes scabra]
MPFSSLGTISHSFVVLHDPIHLSECHEFLFLKRFRTSELPYKSFVRGKEVDFSPSNIRRVMRFKRETTGAQTDYKTRQAMDQRLDEVLADLCILGATWKLSSGQPAVPIQLRRTELHPLAKGWQEFIIHALVPTGNKSEVTIARAILIHCIMRGEEVR